MQTAKKIDDMPEDLPYVFLMIPFDRKMNTKEGFEIIVNNAAGKMENELLKKYPEDKVKPVINKMYRVIRSIDHGTSNKSIAIIVSPLVEKIYYFNNTLVEWDSYKIE
jgi:hypothetical protein